MGLETDLKKQLTKWLQHRVIEKSTSPWSFPLVAAPKKNGKIRWCVDYRRLNEATVKDSFPLPHINDNLSRLSRSWIFSCVDGSGAFHVIPIRKEDRSKTSFSTPWGSYQYRQLPFGLCNGPAAYSRLVSLFLDGIPGEVAIPSRRNICKRDRSSREACVVLKISIRCQAEGVFTFNFPKFQYPSGEFAEISGSIRA